MGRCCGVLRPIQGRDAGFFVDFVCVVAACQFGVQPVLFNDEDWSGRPKAGLRICDALSARHQNLVWLTNDVYPALQKRGF